MNINLFHISKNYLVHLCMIILIGTSALIHPSCQKSQEQGKYLIRVDMSKEHDAGRFKPESGDKISIAGTFNGWKKDGLFLSDEDGDWTYIADMGEYVQGKNGSMKPNDTLEFRFVLHSGDGRDIANQGWEKLDNRKATLGYLEKKNPVYIFNEVYDERETFEVTFTVGMNNQKILGFFRPEDGDEVIVSGSFCEWSSEGVPMKDEEGIGIYSVKVTVKQNPKTPVVYRYRIHSKRKAIIPNKGWETQANRQWNLTGPKVEVPYAEFNDMRRVARFIIDTRKWEQEGKFRSKRGDILQIKLMLDGKDHLSDALFQVKEHTFETALIVPVTAKQVQWQVVKNMKEDLTELKNIEVDLKGTVINL